MYVPESMRDDQVLGREWALDQASSTYAGIAYRYHLIKDALS